MSKADIKWKMGGFRQVRSSDGVRRALEAVGHSVANRANARLRKGHQGFKVSSYQGKRAPQGRWQVKVIAASPYARRHNAKHNDLLRALGGQ